ncbi:hypothetical protein HDU97_003010 [Phlyctochytrium planicorne]|nr:hypothetical protein HDU97_003010 [Phlyctochytrium planicorne]
MHSNIIVFLFVLTLAYFAHAGPAEANMKGANTVTDGNLIADQLAHIIKTRCFTEQNAQTNVNAQFKVQNKMNIDANIASAGTNCRLAINLVVGQTQFSANINFAYKNEGGRNTAANALSAVLKKGNTKFPMQLQLQIGGATLNMDAKTQTADQNGCPLGKGAKQVKSGGHTITVRC